MSNNNSSNNKELQYPMLESCRVTLLNPSNNGSTRCGPPVRLPVDCLRAVTNMEDISSQKPYDFELERDIIERCNERHVNMDALCSGNHSEIKKMVMARIKSVTNASDDVCIELLESNGYDLKQSIEAYFQPPSSTTT